MTPYEIELARALGGVSHFPGTSKKRFCREMAHLAEHDAAREISLRQRHYMECLAWYYRRRLPRHLVPDREPLPLPPKIKPPKGARRTVRAAPAEPASEQKEFVLCPRLPGSSS